VDGWHRLEGPAAADVPRGKEEYAQMAQQDFLMQIDQLALRVSLVKALFLQFAKAECKLLGCRVLANIIPRLQERYFIQKLPPSGKKSAPQRRCVVCAKHRERKDTRFCCLQCDVGLCMEEYLKHITQNLISKIIKLF
jgi:hypothetical protein